MCKTCVLNIEKWWWRKLKKFYIKGKVYCDYVLKDDVVKMSCMHAQSLQTLCAPVDCSPPGSSVHGILQTRVLEWITMPSSREASRPRDQTLLSYISWIGQNTGVGSLSLFQWIFSTQGSNPGLLHCGWILYQLNHKCGPLNWQVAALPLAPPGKPSKNVSSLQIDAQV